MKNQIAIAIVLVTGIISVNAITPPLPPLPPNWKSPVPKRVKIVKGAELLTSTYLKEARFSPASEPVSSGVSSNGVLFNPFIFVDPDPQWGKLAVASAHQGTNTILRVTYAFTLTGERKVVTELACYHVDQVFWVSTTGNHPQIYMFGENIPCTPGFLPAGKEKLGFTLDFYQKEYTTENGKRVEKNIYLGKGAKVEDHPVADGFILWKKQP